MDSMTQQARIFVIAEAGVNHNQSLELAIRLINAAVEAGADAVKFQTYITEEVVALNTAKADYQLKETNAAESQFEMLKRLEMSTETHAMLIEHCKSKGIPFISSPFDLTSADLLIDRFKLPLLKIGSGEITNAPLLLRLACSGNKLILSTGMSTLGEIETALSVLAFGYTRPKVVPSLQSFREAYWSAEGQLMLQEKVILLHCTTEYPTPYSEVNLRVMDTMQAAFSLPVGYSDHTMGIAIALAAAARGASVIEKHLTIDRSLPGPDHKASLEPVEFKQMVESIRQIEAALGSSAKLPTASELKNHPIVRKSLAARNAIVKGEPFTNENIKIVRPGSGISPINYWTILGKTATQSYNKDELINE
jgi:N-acetylneuraminate synthase